MVHASSKLETAFDLQVSASARISCSSILESLAILTTRSTSSFSFITMWESWRKHLRKNLMYEFDDLYVDLSLVCKNLVSSCFVTPLSFAHFEITASVSMSCEMHLLNYGICFKIVKWLRFTFAAIIATQQSNKAMIEIMIMFLFGFNRSWLTK